VIDGICSACGQIRNVYTILVEKSEGKRSLGTSRHRLDDDIKIYFKETICEVVDWIVWFMTGSRGVFL
jgi:hypothetical protein